MSTNYHHVCLHSFGYKLPENVLPSHEIERRLSPVYKRLKLPVGRLEMMSGIKERRLWPEGTLPSQAATLAGQETLKKSGVAPSSIQCLIFTSVSRDMMEPATASFVHHALGLSRDCLLFDLSNACLGFLDGIMVLGNMIELGQVQNGLIVSGETAESLIESTLDTLLTDESLTRKSIKSAFASLTIGSGAVGLYMCRCDQGERERPRLSRCSWRASTEHTNLCKGGTVDQHTTLMATSSEELMIEGVNTARQTWQDFSSGAGWNNDQIDHYFCHQVGSAHARLLFEKLELTAEKNYETLSFLGNVGSVSAPITMARAIEQRVFGPGQKGALLGIGSGINCMMMGVEW